MTQTPPLPLPWRVQRRLQNGETPVVARFAYEAHAKLYVRALEAVDPNAALNYEISRVSAPQAATQRR